MAADRARLRTASHFVWNDGDDDVPFLVLVLHVAMGFRDLLEQVASINHRLECATLRKGRQLREIARPPFGVPSSTESARPPGRSACSQAVRSADVLRLPTVSSTRS